MSNTASGITSSGALQKSNSFEGRKGLPKTNSFDNVEFMTATMNDTFIKGSEEIKQCLETLVLAKGADAGVAATELANLINAAGVRAFSECGVVERLKKMLSDRETSEAALKAVMEICKQMGSKAEPFMVPFLPNVLTAASDKKSKEVREAADACGPAIIEICNAQASKNVQVQIERWVKNENEDADADVLSVRPCLLVCLFACVCISFSC